MLTWVRRTILLLLAGASAACTSRNTVGKMPPDGGWMLTWQDEFDGADGAAPDPTKWKALDGFFGSNGELQYNTSRPVNVEQDGSGHLAIHVLSDTTYQGYQYTSGRVSTDGLFSQRYGRFEARIQMPAGQGVWPAFWMLGDDFNNAGWPACGGIDVAEQYAQESSTVRAGIHATGYTGMELVGSHVVPGAPLSSDFHVYAVEWQENLIRWLVDDVSWQTMGPADIPAGAPWPFDHPFSMLLDVAIGGKYAGDPDATTALPQTMLVDYVRVFQN